jgi:hypothetical protein
LNPELLLAFVSGFRRLAENTPPKKQDGLFSLDLSTGRKIKQIVNSWPEWKRERIVFRDKSTSTTSSQAAPLETIALRKRSV